MSLSLSLPVLTAPTCPPGKHLLLLYAYCKCHLLRELLAALARHRLLARLPHHCTVGRAVPGQHGARFYPLIRQLGVQHVCQISGVLKKPVALFQEKRDLALNCVDVEFVVTLTVISHSEIQ